MITRSAMLRSLLLLAGGSILSTASWAQGFEVSGFGGAVTMNGGVGTHALYGGAGAVRLASVHVFGEFSHATLLTETVSGVNADAKLNNYGGGLDYSFGSSRVRPYVTAGVGVGHFYATASGSGANVSLGITNAIYGQAGGGARVYLGKHWGVKPEVRYAHYTGTSSLVGATLLANAVQFTVGLFFGN